MSDCKISIPITGFFIYRYGFINVVMYGLITIFIEILFVLLLIIAIDMYTNKKVYSSIREGTT